MDYFKLTIKERETYLMPRILRALNNLGGTSSTNELRKQLGIDEPDLVEAIEFTKSGKNGAYHPFEFQFRFALKSLAYAEYIKYERAMPVELTEKGMRTEPMELKPETDVYPLSDPKWGKKKAENKRKREQSQKTIEEELDAPEDDLQEKFETELLEAIGKMPPQKFEILCRGLLKKMGVTLDQEVGVAYSGDGGIDGYGYHLSDDFRTSRVAIQAKRWQGKVSSPEIDKFRGAIDKFRADYGIFITNSYFTKDAIDAARAGSRAITLIDGDKLVGLIERHQLYVKPVETFVLGEFYLGDE